MRRLIVEREDVSARIFKTYINALNNDKIDTVISLLNYKDLDVSISNNLALLKISNLGNNEAIIKFIDHPKFILSLKEYEVIKSSVKYNFDLLFKTLIDKFNIPFAVLSICIQDSLDNKNFYISGLILTYSNFCEYIKEDKDFIEYLNSTDIKSRNFILPYFKAQDF
jgi:hypothetical protein